MKQPRAIFRQLTYLNSEVKSAWNKFRRFSKLLTVYLQFLNLTKPFVLVKLCNLLLQFAKLRPQAGHKRGMFPVLIDGLKSSVNCHIFFFVFCGHLSQRIVTYTRELKCRNIEKTFQWSEHYRRILLKKEIRVLPSGVEPKTWKVPITSSDALPLSYRTVVQPRPLN